MFVTVFVLSQRKQTMMRAPLDFVRMQEISHIIELTILRGHTACPSLPFFAFADVPLKRLSHINARHLHN